MLAFRYPEAAMDNRINETRRKIRCLRADMLEREAAIRRQINEGQDCAESSFRLLAMRREMVALVREWKRLGGCERLPTVYERLKESYRLVSRPQAVKVLPKRKMQKRRLAALG
jgi:hypothetical protein